MALCFCIFLQRDHYISRQLGQREWKKKRVTVRVRQRFRLGDRRVREGKWLKRRRVERRRDIYKARENVVSKDTKANPSGSFQMPPPLPPPPPRSLLPNPLSALNQELNGLLQCSSVHEQKGAWMSNSPHRGEKRAPFRSFSIPLHSLLLCQHILCSCS